MKIHLKVTENLLDEVKKDLQKPHPVAFERVGFLACAGGNTSLGLVLLAQTFHPVRDDDYEPDDFVGARINSHAVQSALAFAYGKPRSMLFVHEHAHLGTPEPSRVDLNCWRELIPNFWHVRPELPHGALILSEDSAMGVMWVPHRTDLVPIGSFSVVGRRLRRWSKEEHD